MKKSLLTMTLVCLAQSGSALASADFEFKLSDIDASAIRSLDGHNNNLLNPTWGATERPLLRFSPAAYSDGVSSHWTGMNMNAYAGSASTPPSIW